MDTSMESTCVWNSCIGYFKLVFCLEYFLWYGLLVWKLVGTLVYVRDSSYLEIMFHLRAIFGFIEVLEVVLCFFQIQMMRFLGSRMNRSTCQSTGRSFGWMQ